MNAVIRGQLERYAGSEGRRREAVERLLAISDRTHASSGPGGRSWTQEGLYEERTSSSRAGGDPR